MMMNAKSVTLRLCLLLGAAALCRPAFVQAAEYNAGDPCLEAGAFHTKNDALIGLMQREFLTGND